MAVAQAGREAGTLFIPALNRSIKLVEWREDDFYDTVVTGHAAVGAAVAAVGAGTTLELFRDIGNKNLQHTNFRTARRIPAGSEFIMSRIGVVPNQAFGDVVPVPDAIVKLAYAATLTFKINDRLVSEGPLYKYQSGYGVTGSIAIPAAATAPSGLTTIGVPSAAAAPNLMVAQPVSDDDDFVATIDFRGQTWAATSGAAGAALGPTPLITGMAITVVTHGFIKKPQGK